MHSLTINIYTYNDINTPTTVNGFAVLYAILIGLIMTLLIVSIFLKGVNYTGYKKAVIGAVVFTVCVSIIYGVCLYFLTSNYTRLIVKQDLSKSQTNTNKIKS